MAKKIRFPLKMKNGAEVRTLDELKENFDLESVLGYFTDGKLSTWLADRYYDEKAEAVAVLSADMPDLNAKLCEILEVEYEAETDETDLEYIQRRSEKLKILSSVTADQDILKNIDLVAMNQDELYDILDEGSNKVYLYGDKFEIPFGKKNISYIGVNEPLVIIDKSKYAEDFEDSGIVFKNVKFEEGAYQKNNRYPDPVGEFEIEDDVLIKAKADENGVCIIPYGVKIIGKHAYSDGNYDWALKKLTIPNTVTVIGEAAFYGCQNLTDLQIPEGVEIIERRAFGDCDSITSVVIPHSVTRLGDFSFVCKNLTSVTILNGKCPYFGFHAFYDDACNTWSSQITEVNVPADMDRDVIIDLFRDTPWGRKNGYYNVSITVGNEGGIGRFLKGIFG